MNEKVPQFEREDRPQNTGINDLTLRIIREVNERAATNCLDKDVQKIVRKLAKLLSLSERAVIERAVKELWAVHQPKARKKRE